VPVADTPGRLPAAGPVHKGTLKGIVFPRHLEEHSLVLHKIPPVGVDKIGQGLELGMGGKDFFLLRIVNEIEPRNILALKKSHKFLGAEIRKGLGLIHNFISLLYMNYYRIGKDG
jgi:hypothetical protein